MPGLVTQRIAPARPAAIPESGAPSGSGRLQRRFPVERDIDFLTRRGVSQPLITAASRQAAAHGTTVLKELFALGVEREQYWSLVADDLGLGFAADLTGAKLLLNSCPLATEAVRLATSILIRIGRDTILVTAPDQREVALLRGRLALNPELADRIRIASPETIRAFIGARRAAALTHYAVHRLAGVLPRLSAGRRLSPGANGAVPLLAAALAFLLVAPVLALTTFGLCLTLFFVNCSFWKLASAFRRLRPLRLEPIFDDRLPTYAVLVLLYREAAVVPDLLEHLWRIDYPKTKLQILLLLEADDSETRAAMKQHLSEPHFEVIVIPPGGPRTKPKALTYALSFVRADYVVVFDAEDRPEPAQLRKAVAAFRERPELGCVQARLAPDNHDSWLARMFTVEYAANFEVVLPALAEWRVPLPLGGTSNHFPGIM